MYFWFSDFYYEKKFMVKNIIKTIKWLKEIKRKENNKKNKANQGGCQAHVEVLLRNSGPSAKGLVWLFWSCICWLTGPYDGLHLLTLGWKLMAMWQAWTWGCMMDPGACTAWEWIRKNNNNCMGDLGIEPRSQCLQYTSLANWSIAFVM